MKKQPRKLAKLLLAKETLSRLDVELSDLKKIKGGDIHNNGAAIIETDQYSECFC